jgi:hypothetical protein
MKRAWSSLCLEVQSSACCVTLARPFISLQGRSPRKREQYHCVPARSSELNEMRTKQDMKPLSLPDDSCSLQWAELNSKQLMGPTYLEGLRLPPHRISCFTSVVERSARAAHRQPKKHHGATVTGRQPRRCSRALPHPGCALACGLPVLLTGTDVSVRTGPHGVCVLLN